MRLLSPFSLQESRRIVFAERYVFTMCNESCFHPISPVPGPGNKIDSTAEMLYDYIEKNHASPITIASMAQALCICKTNLYLLCKTNFHQPPMQIVNHYRIQEAKARLLAGNDPVCVIAREVGITDTNYFSKLFKKQTRMTPSEFRRNGRTKDGKAGGGTHEAH